MAPALVPRRRKDPIAWRAFPCAPVAQRHWRARRRFGWWRFSFGLTLHALTRSNIHGRKRNVRLHRGRCACRKCGWFHQAQRHFTPSFGGDVQCYVSQRRDLAAAQSSGQAAGGERSRGTQICAAQTRLLWSENALETPKEIGPCLGSLLRRIPLKSRLASIAATRPITEGGRAKTKGEVHLDHNQLGIVRRAMRPCHWFWVPEHHGSAAISTSISD